MIRKNAIALLYFLLATVACKENYVARTRYPRTGYLVVEGFIDAGGGTTHFRLSRTTTLDSAFLLPETGADATVESDDNQSFALAGDGRGIYSALIAVNPAAKYRLRIRTGNKEYLSDFADPRITPAIDSLHWEEKQDGVRISVNSHDPSGGTIYYKWTFSETWKYSARYFSSLVWEGDTLQYRNDNQQIYTCWRTDTASTLLLASTQKLAQDMVAGQPVTFIHYNEPFNKLYNRYSILVTQAALTKDEYEWYDRLKKNTESLGSIFDAQPSEISGNIHSLNDPTEPVIGYLGCRTETAARIFISRSQLQVQYLSSGYESCRQDSFFTLDREKLRDIFGPQGYDIPVTNIYLMGRLAGVAGSTRGCTDCREKGGVLQRPSFWID